MTDETNIKGHLFENALIMLDNVLRLADCVLPELDDPARDDQRLICILLLERMVELSRATRAAIVSGCPHAAAILLRADLLAMAKIRAVKSDASWAQRLARGTAHEHAKVVRWCIDKCESGDPQIATLETRLQELGNTKNCRLTDFDVMEKAGFAELHHSAYRMLCSAVHSDLRSFEDNVELEGQSLKRLKRTAPFAGATLNLTSCTDWLLVGLGDCCELFGIDEQTQAQWQELRYRMDMLLEADGQ